MFRLETENGIQYTGASHVTVATEDNGGEVNLDILKSGDNQKASV